MAAKKVVVAAEPQAAETVVVPVVEQDTKPAKVEVAQAPVKEKPKTVPAETSIMVEATSLLAKGSAEFASGTESLLRAVERLNTITNRLEAKVTIPDGFATRDELKTAVEIAVETRVVDVKSAISSLKGELALAFNSLARAVCTACGVVWEDEPSSYFFPGTPAAPSTNGDQEKTSDLEKALEELTI